MKRLSTERAREFAEAYLQERKRKYLYIHELTEKNFRPDERLITGPYHGQKRDVWWILYEVDWLDETKSLGIYMDAYTGEVYYTITPTGFVEDWE